MTIAPTIIGGHKKFQKDMKEIKVEITKMNDTIMKAVARKVLGRLGSRSPIRTGRYITNHKVNETGQSSYDTRYTEPSVHRNRKSAVGFMMGKGQRAIGMLKNPKKITISNTVDYAQNVETGWQFERGSAPGYFVYAHTHNDMLEETPKTIKQEEAKTQAKINGL